MTNQQIINTIRQLVARGGGGGGLPSTLTADTTIEQNGFFFRTLDGGRDLFYLAPHDSGDSSFFETFYDIDDGNISGLTIQANEESVNWEINGNFNDGVKGAGIRGEANATTSILTFNGAIINEDLVAADYADDTDAAAAGIAEGGLYHTAGILKVRLPLP